jgi:serine/threonine protein kinase
MALEPDTLLINRYRIVEILGQGGMGFVYRAVDENLSVDVALKENLYTSGSYTRQFRREATILATMRHPNLPRVSDHFEIEDQGQYLVMDYIEGEDLRDRMDRLGILEEEEVIVIGAAICDALTYLHSRNPPILHRDIKPGNIKIDPEGQIYLVDFGLAKIARGSKVTTSAARAMTPGYSSPEQYGTARTDSRSDIYSLAAMLYAALTSVIPEDGLARAMEQADLTSLRKRNPKVSRRLASVIEQGLAIHPDDRYGTAEEFREELLTGSGTAKKISESNELTIPPPPPEVIEAMAKERAERKGYPLQPEILMSGESSSRVRRRKTERIRRTLIYVFSIITIIGVAASYYYGGLPFVQIESLLPISVKPLSTPTNTPIADFPFLTVTNTNVPPATLTNPPDTETLTQTYIPPSPTRTSTQTYIPEPATTPTIIQTVLPEVYPIGGGNGILAFVSTRSGEPQIWFINVDGSGLTQFSDLPGGACQPDWSPDGSQMVFISPCKRNQNIYYDSFLFLINTDGTGLVRIIPTLGSFDPAWSPDGSSILYTLADNASHTRIFLLNLADNSVQLMTDNNKLNMHPEWSPDGTEFAFISTLQAGQRIWIMSKDLNGEPENFSLAAPSRNSSPTWSSTGDRMVFTKENENGLSVLLFAMLNSREGIEYREVLVSSGSPVVPEKEPDFSPDGNWIAYESWPGGENHDIYIMKPNGADRQQLTSDPGFDFDAVWYPVWSPDQPE